MRFNPPRINATVDCGIHGCHAVTVWNIDDESDKAVYVVRAATEDGAARKGMRRFLAERADDEGSLDVRSDGPQSQSQA